MNKIAELYQTSKELQELPGVYRMIDDLGNILYIGKSINIKKRVGSYFATSTKHSKKIRRMVRLVDHFQVFYTPTEIEALILECRWIQYFKPTYNTLLKDSSKYRYICLKEEPRLQVTLCRTKKATGVYLGPFPHPKLARKAVRAIKDRYPYLDCDKTEKGCSGCMSYELKRCEGIEGRDTQKSLQELYAELIGKEKEVVTQLKKRMELATDMWEYERAREIWNHIQGLKYVAVTHEKLRRCIKGEMVLAKIPSRVGYLPRYMVLYKGQIVWSKVGTSGEHSLLAQSLYTYLQQKRKDDDRDITPEVVEEALLLENYKRKVTHSLKIPKKVYEKCQLDQLEELLQRLE